MDPEARTRYLSSPLNRSLNTALPVQSRMYNSWKLGSAAGKTIVITEGEFKSAIATRSTGILHLGILGIHEFDESMLQAIVDAKPAKVIVVLDRDPKAMALQRVDEVTDS